MESPSSPEHITTVRSNGDWNSIDDGIEVDGEW